MFFYIIFFMVILAAFLYLNHILYCFWLGAKAGTFNSKESIYYTVSFFLFVAQQKCVHFYCDAAGNLSSLGGWLYPSNM